MTVTSRNRPVTVFVLLGLLVLLGVGGLYGGIALLMDTSGAVLGVDVGLLESVPVDDFLLPGLFLITVLGVVPLFAAYGLWARPEWTLPQRLNPWRDLHWSWALTRVIAVVLILFVGLEFLMWGNESPLQVIFLSVGVAMLVMCGYPSIRGYLWMGETPEYALEVATDDTTEGSTEDTAGDVDKAIEAESTADRSVDPIGKERWH